MSETLKKTIKLVEGYFDPFGGDYIELKYPIIYNSLEKILNPKNIKLAFKKGTKIEFVVMIYEFENEKGIKKPSIVEETIE